MKRVKVIVSGGVAYVEECPTDVIVEIEDFDNQNFDVDEDDDKEKSESVFYRCQDGQIVECDGDEGE